ncbi:MAG: hypothetical protein WCF17_05915 [Terracidiphilus sp.]
MKRIALFLGLAFLIASPVAPAQMADTAAPAATLASLSGTYTIQAVSLDDYSVMQNMYGQQVGFCYNGSTPISYGCWDTYTFDTYTFSVVSNGAGAITSGTYTQTSDPNSYECNPKDSPTTPCPVIVPSTNTYSSTEAYKIGATVNFKVSTVTRTFQAVRANTGKPPNWSVSAAAGNICTGNNPATCYWTQITHSLTGENDSGSGTLKGTYTITASGLGTVTVTPSNCNGCGTVEFSIIVPPVSQVGQSISIMGINKLGNKNNMTGSGVRVK